MGRLTFDALEIFRREDSDSTAEVDMPIDYSLFRFPKGQIRALEKVDKARTHQAKLDACYAAVDARDGLIDRVTGKRVVVGSADRKLTRTRHHLDERSTAPHKKYDPANVIVVSAYTHTFLQSHAIEVEGTDANKRLLFRWNRKMVSAGKEPFRIPAPQKGEDRMTPQPPFQTQAVAEEPYADGWYRQHPWPHRQLICEGGCNPDIDGADRELRRWREGAGRRQAAAMPPPPIYIVDRLNRLKHTDHRVLNDLYAECTVCGHRREHGGNSRDARQSTLNAPL